jgi:hypothetical protein
MSREKLGVRKCSSCKAWNLDDSCDLEYKQKTDPIHGIGPAEPCPKPKYVYEYRELMEQKYETANQG